MVETSNDKSSQCGRLISGSERIIWEAVKQELDIGECFQRGRGLKYT
jgi:hypothetical protein